MPSPLRCRSGRAAGGPGLPERFVGAGLGSRESSCLRDQMDGTALHGGVGGIGYSTGRHGFHELGRGGRVD